MSFKPAISSMSLGRAWHHSLPHKLTCAALHNFHGIEIFHEDLEHVARSLPVGSSDSTQIEAARIIRRLCNERNLEIICLQPFMQYEGLLDRSEHEQRIRKLTLWFKLVKILGTETIQIPSNFIRDTGKVTGDRDVIVRDMIEVAEMGLRETPVVKFAYENLCWGTFVDTWEQVWEVVERVDRPNFGMCLDTFNIAGRVWADPADPSGKTLNADADLAKSLDRMRRAVDPRKIFFIQVVDAEKLERPLVKGHPFYVDGQKARMNWSRNARLFPFEEEGYLPILDVLRAFLDCGYTGWVSFELFSRTMSDPKESVPEDHARRGEVSWRKLCAEMGWEVESRSE